MKRKTWVALIVSLAVVFAIEIVFVPTVAVLTSPPDSSSTPCVAARASATQCTFTASYYSGGGS